MSQITPGEARSRQTAYLATEHWWRSRVEKLLEQYRHRWEQADARGEHDRGAAFAQTIASLEGLLRERNPR